MFQGCSGVVPGCSALFRWCSGGVPGVPGCSGVFRDVPGVFRVLQTPSSCRQIERLQFFFDERNRFFKRSHVTSEIVYIAHWEEVLINYFRDVIRYQGS